MIFFMEDPIHNWIFYNFLLMSWNNKLLNPLPLIALYWSMVAHKKKTTKMHVFWLNLAKRHFMLMFWRYILTLNTKKLSRKLPNLQALPFMKESILSVFPSHFFFNYVNMHLSKLSKCYLGGRFPWMLVPFNKFEQEHMCTF